LGRTVLGSDGLPAVNGLVGSLPFHWWSEREEPGIALINEQADANKRQLSAKNIAYLLGWGVVDGYTELYTQTVNRVGSLEAVTGKDMKETIENAQFSPLGLYNFDFKGGEIRAYRQPDRHDGLPQQRPVRRPSGDDARPSICPMGRRRHPDFIPLSDFAPAPICVRAADVPPRIGEARRAR
jgi:hypothetical protein